MAAELQTDPYTLVAQHLQDGEATRAELRAFTDLDYAQIEAALERFEMMETVTKRTDGKGIEHYRWQGEEYRPEPSRAVVRPVVAVESGATFKDGVADDAEAGPVKKGRPVGWSLSAKVQEFIDGQADGAEFSMPDVYDWLIKHFANACETYESGALRNRISMCLLTLVGRSISHVGQTDGGRGQKAKLYQKGLAPSNGHKQSDLTREQFTETLQKVSARRPGVTHGAPPIPLDYERIESLRAKGMTIQEVSLHLGQAPSTLNNRRASDKRLDDALNNGWERYCETKPDDRNIPVNTQIEDIADSSASTETTNQAIAEQPLDEIGRNERIALRSPEVKQNGSAIYALPSFIADLRSERDELDLLIALLEKRMMRGGQA